MDELAHLILCPFMQHNSVLRTWPSIVTAPSKSYCKPQAQPLAVSCSRTARLSCPQTKKLSSSLAGDKICLHDGGVSKTQTSKTQTSDPKNSDPRVSRKLRPRKNSDPRVSRKLRPEKLRPLDVSKTQTRKTQTLWVSRKLRPEK